MRRTHPTCLPSSCIGVDIASFYKGMLGLAAKEVLIRVCSDFEIMHAQQHMPA